MSSFRPVASPLWSIFGQTPCLTPPPAFEKTLTFRWKFCRSATAAKVSLAPNVASRCVVRSAEISAHARHTVLGKAPVCASVATQAQAVTSHVQVLGLFIHGAMNRATYLCEGLCS